MAALGQLVVSLTAQTAQFTQAMDRAAYQSQRNFQSITSAAKMAGAAIGLALSGSAFIRSIKAQIDLGDEIAKTSQKIGVQGEELQKLRYAADLSGVSNETLTRALSRLSTEAVNGSEGLSKLGVSARDSSGNLKSSDQLLKEVAANISKYRDGTEKSALATELFGERIARDLIPFLNLGADGIKKLTDEAEQFGFVISQETQAAAERFNDNLTRLGKIVDGLFVRLAADLLPTLEAFTEQLIELGKNSTVFETIGKAALVTFQTITVLGANVIFVFEGIYRTVTAAAQALKAFVTGDFDKYREIIANLQTENQAARASLDAFEEGIMNIGKATKETQKVITDNNFAEGVSDQLSKIAERNKESLSLYEEYKKLYEQTVTPIQRLADEEAKLLNLRERLVIAGYDQVAVDRMIAEARLNLADAMADVSKKTVEANKTALAFGDAFSSAFENAIISGNNLRGVLQGLLQDIIKIALRTAITEPLGKAIASAIPSFSFGSTQTPAPITDISVRGSGQALGGPVKGGNSYLVGEKGPEIFTAPAGGGQIIPNSAMGDNVVVNQTFNISAGVSQTVRAEISNLMPRIMEATKAAVVDSRRRGGTFSKAFS